MTTTETRPADTQPRVEHHLGLRLLGAALAIGVAYIHVKDQGGFPGDKTPSYVGVGYWILEGVALLTAVALLAGSRRHTLKAWVLTAGVALGPLLGYVLSRGPGLPGYTDDKGNWTEPLGLVSLLVEGLLFLIAAALIARSRRP